MNWKKQQEFLKIKNSLINSLATNGNRGFADIIIIKVRVGGKIRLVSCWELHPGCDVLATYQVILKAKKR